MGKKHTHKHISCARLCLPVLDLFHRNQRQSLQLHQAVLPNTPIRAMVAIGTKTAVNSVSGGPPDPDVVAVGWEVGAEEGDSEKEWSSEGEGLIQDGVSLIKGPGVRCDAITISFESSSTAKASSPPRLASLQLPCVTPANSTSPSYPPAISRHLSSFSVPFCQGVACTRKHSIGERRPGPNH